MFYILGMRCRSPELLRSTFNAQEILLAKKKRWLLLIHQIPRTPGYLRVKIWRRLQRLGAVPIKNSVYAAPTSKHALEDFIWVLREIEAGGGEGSICEAQFVEGLTDAQVEAMFRSARAEDYRSIIEEARALSELRSHGDKAANRNLDDEVDRLKKRLDEVRAIDYFGATSRDDARNAVSRLQKNVSATATPAAHTSVHDLKGKTWVTRSEVYVDRMASAWLIRRFIDSRSRFKFVAAKNYEPRSAELRFDMFGGEFTHEGDCCTFEVLLGRAGLKDPALIAISQIVHDIDLKDAKFSRAESAGIERVIQGIALAHRDDRVRLERSGPIFDDLYRYFSKKRR